MAEHRETITSEEIPRLLGILEGRDVKAQCDALTRLCPCRSRCDDREIWLTIVHAHECSPDAEVRDRARHAIDTLREHARTDPDLRELARWLSDRDGTGRLKRSVSHGRVTSRDMPRLLEILDGDDAEAQCDALRHLCPCRNRRYDREVWLAIFRAYENAEGVAVRDQALHAIETLRERVRTDPRSQELVRWLADEGADVLALEHAIPVWNPRHVRAGAKLPPIPRWERGHRSKPNKQR